MIKTLENGHLKIQVKHHGAELCSLIDKSTNTEYIWQADAAYWGRHAPILFPIVGKLKEDQYIIREKSYPMKQHGLARNMDFDFVDRKKSSLTFELNSSEVTLKNYPFPFRLRIQYILNKNVLMVEYQVFNPVDEELYFSIGGHPAFRCPLQEGEKRSDYQLVFEKNELASTQRLDSGIRNGNTDLILNNTQYLPLKDILFDEDALVFKGLNSDKVNLQNGQIPILTFDFKGFPYLGIWSKNRTAPFVCIEPWFGVADVHTHNQQLMEKEGILQLAGQGHFDCLYSIMVH